MKMTFEEAIAYLGKFNGTKCTQEQFEKAKNFISKLPQHPNSFEYLWQTRLNVHEATLTNYDTQISYTVKFKYQHGEFWFGIFDEFPIENPSRVKKAQSNAEALILMEQYRNVKFAVDIDRWYDMSDDPSVGRWARKRNEDATREQIDIAIQL